jgi:hypothetical protein
MEKLAGRDLYPLKAIEESKQDEWDSRDPVIGHEEAQKRLQYLPAIIEKSRILLTELSLQPDEVYLIPILSAAADICQNETVDEEPSDLDIGVVVPDTHAFIANNSLWEQYKHGLKTVEKKSEDTFAVHPHLLIFKDGEHYLVGSENLF